MLRILPLIILLSLSYTFAIGQNLSWKKHKKTAEQLYKVGNYLEAAMHFEKAWEKKLDNKALIYQAGECYTLLKDFKKASLSYQQVKDDDEFELVGLKYARALKQDGQYEAAKRAFLDFSSAYQGKDKTLLNQIASKEIKGCDLGMRLANAGTNHQLEVRPLGENINSLKTEIAPIAFAEDLLYFSSTRKEDKAFLYRSQKQRGNWSKAVAAESLPNIPDKHLANGTFTPDSKRFYFTLCEDNSKGSGLVSICKIYVIKRVGSGWSEPIPMRDYINEAGATTTHPYVIHQAGQEILYFVSNRKGGKGGMDIWRTVRDINSGDIDFTYPINLGKQVNTLGDEMTPFYDATSGVLYFSSNGHITLGGWDIFKSTGDEQTWEHPENMGMPINSSADDFYYTLKPSRKGGFLVSNRIAGPEKVSTQHEDIFEFGKATKQRNLFVSGEIMEKESPADIQHVSIALYELVNGKERLLQRKKSNANDYRFPVLANRHYRIAVEKEGYLKNTFDFNTLEGKRTIKHDFFLNKASTQPAPPIARQPKKTKPTRPTTTAPPPPKVVRTNTTTTTKVNTPPIRKPRPTTSYNKPPVVSTPPARSVSTGVYYKVQLIAINFYNPKHPRYKNVKHLAPIETEPVPNNSKVFRVLLTSFKSKQEARSMMQQARGFGFADAFMVKYRDGKRLGMVYE